MGAQHYTQRQVQNYGAGIATVFGSEWHLCLGLPQKGEDRLIHAVLKTWHAHCQGIPVVTEQKSSRLRCYMFAVSVGTCLQSLLVHDCSLCWYMVAVSIGTCLQSLLGYVCSSWEPLITAITPRGFGDCRTAWRWASPWATCWTLLPWWLLMAQMLSGSSSSKRWTLVRSGTHHFHFSSQVLQSGVWSQLWLIRHLGLKSQVYVMCDKSNTTLIPLSPSIIILPHLLHALLWTRVGNVGKSWPEPQYSRE